MSHPVDIPDEKAKRILQRAAELDRTRVDAIALERLREAAREAGISEASFEAALAESEAPASPPARISRRRLLAGLAAAALLGGLAVSRLLVPVEEREAPRSPMTGQDTPLARP